MNFVRKIRLSYVESKEWSLFLNYIFYENFFSCVFPDYLSVCSSWFFSVNICTKSNTASSKNGRFCSSWNGPKTATKFISWINHELMITRIIIYVAASYMDPETQTCATYGKEWAVKVSGKQLAAIECIK